MTIARTLLLNTAFVSILALAGDATAQGKKKPSSTPGTAAFRCNGLMTPCPDGDLIVGDGTDYQGLGAPEGGQGAHLRWSNNEMWIGLKNGLKLYVDFVQQDQNADCLGGGYCQFDFAFPDDDVLIDGPYDEIQTDVIDPITGDPAKTLLDIPVDATWEARVYIGFNDPNTGRLWNFNFSDDKRAEASNALVTRAGACTWEITDGGGTAVLSTLVRLNGKLFRSYEGFYSAPFQITFEACPAP